MKIVKYILKCDNCDIKADDDKTNDWIEIECDMKIGSVDNSFRAGSSFCSKKCAVEHFGKKIDELFKRV